MWLCETDSQPATPELCEDFFRISVGIFARICVGVYRIFYASERINSRILRALHLHRIFSRAAFHQKHQHRRDGRYFYVHSDVFLRLRLPKILDFTEYFPPKTRRSLSVAFSSKLKKVGNCFPLGAHFRLSLLAFLFRYAPQKELKHAVQSGAQFGYL